MQTPFLSKSLYLKTIILGLMLCYGQLLMGQCPHPDFEPLKALYAATDGGNWTDNTNWDTSGVTNCNPCTAGWFGLVCQNGRVTQLALDTNQLIGSIPAEIGNLTQLTFLDLNDNQLSGTIPTTLGNLSLLEKLLLQKNQLDGTIPTELGTLSLLADLNLGANQLDGNIPIVLGTLSNLVGLNLSGNQLDGTIPTELGNLSNLNGLVLSDNMLTGAIPISLGNLTNLAVLRMSSNQLSGAIPKELGNLINVQDLWLDRNELGSSIPPELGGLSSIKRLWLFNNEFTDTLPHQLCSLSTANEILLNNNPFFEPGSDIPYQYEVFCGNTSVNLTNTPLAETVFANFCDSGSGSSYNPCPGNRLVDYIITNDTILAASDTITADQVIMTDSTTFLAGKVILLEAGFHAEAGNVFIAKIEACDFYHEVVSPPTSLEASRKRPINNPKKEVASIFAENNWQIYPNPTSGHLQVQFNQAVAVDLFLMDATGRKIASRKGVEYQTTFDLATFPAGMYVLHVLDRNTKERAVKKVVKIE